MCSFPTPWPPSLSLPLIAFSDEIHHWEIPLVKLFTFNFLLFLLKIIIWLIPWLPDWPWMLFWVDSSFLTALLWSSHSSNIWPPFGAAQVHEAALLLPLCPTPALDPAPDSAPDSAPDWPHPRLRPTLIVLPLYPAPNRICCVLSVWRFFFLFNQFWKSSALPSRILSVSLLSCSFLFDF